MIPGRLPRAWFRHAASALVACVGIHAVGAAPALHAEAGPAQAAPALVTPARPAPPSLGAAFSVQGGVRGLHIQLLADRKGRPFDGSFIGTIYRLEAHQDYLPYRPYLEIVSRWGFGIGVSADMLSVATRDDGEGDGDVKMRGTYLYGLMQFSNRTRATPYAEIGRVFYANRFDPMSDWYARGRREFIMDDGGGTFGALGCRVALANHWALDLYARYVKADVDGTYIFRGDSRRPEPFVLTLEHMAYGLGLGYTFP